MIYKVVFVIISYGLKYMYSNDSLCILTSRNERFYSSLEELKKVNVVR